MAFRNKIYLITLGIVAQLWFFSDVRADELQSNDNAAEQEIVTAATHHHNVTLVSSQPWVVEGGEVWGTLAAYVYDVTLMEGRIYTLSVYRLGHGEYSTYAVRDTTSRCS